MSNEIDAALDALELDVMPQDEVVEPEIVDEVEAVEDDKPSPPGYIDNIEDWVKAGKDPDLFKGKKAYEAEYQRIQEIKELKDLVKTVVNTAGEWKSQQQAQMNQQIELARAEAKAALERAREDQDIEAFERASNKLNTLNAPVQPVPQPNPVVADFIRSNPIIDPNRPEYDVEFHSDVRMLYNSTLNNLTGGDPNMASQLTESQIQRSLAYAMNKAKELHQDKFKSPRNTRQNAAPTAPKRSGVVNSGDYGTRLKAFDRNAEAEGGTTDAHGIYEMIKSMDPKRAELFAKKLLGDK